MADKSNNNSTYHSNDTFDLMRRKIIINRMSVATFDKQLEYFDTVDKFQNINRVVALKKKALVEQLEPLFTAQMSNMTKERQDEITRLYGEINACDVPTEEFIATAKKLEKLSLDMKEMYAKIQELEATIPMDKIMTQYTVKNHQ